MLPLIDGPCTRQTKKYVPGATPPSRRRVNDGLPMPDPSGGGLTNTPDFSATVLVPIKTHGSFCPRPHSVDGDAPKNGLLLKNVASSVGGSSSSSRKANPG